MTSTSLRLRSDCVSTPPRLRRLGLTVVLAMLLAAGGCSQEGSDNASAVKGTGAVVAKVNGAEIRESDIALVNDDIGRQLQSMQPEAKRDYLIAYAADMILLTRAAEEKKLHQSDAFRQHLDLERKKLLMGKLLETEGKAAVTDEAMRKVYDDAIKQLPPEEEVRARHILVETETEAKAIREELRKGADFAELAKQKSKDNTAAAQGGDLGYFTKDQMVPEFAEVAFKLDKNTLSDPVKTSLGWHIIKIEDRRPRPVPAFEEAKPRLEAFVMRKAQAEYLTKLRENAKIERLDKPAAQPETTPMAPSAAPGMAPQAQPEPEKK